MIISGYHVCIVLFLDFIKLDQCSTEGTFGTFQDQIFQYVKGGLKLSFYGGLKMYDLGGLRTDRC